MKRKISIKRILIFILSYFLTGFFRAMILFVPFNVLAKFMGTEKGNYDFDMVLSRKDLNKIRGIAWATNAASRKTPWKSQCMVKALTGMSLLKIFKISSVIYLGLSKDETEGLLAHAWLQVGQYIITGGEEMKGFSVINWYVS